MNNTRNEIGVIQNDTVSIQRKIDDLKRLRDRIEAIRDEITRLKNKINSNNEYLGWLYNGLNSLENWFVKLTD